MGHCFAKFRRLFINVIKRFIFLDSFVIVESFPSYGLRAFRALSRRIGGTKLPVLRLRKRSPEILRLLMCVRVYVC